ncbi:hypothetical protein Ct9H90mP29_15750 [bacterium]|nr:MAG: hypothetical protein Ct9H90mP29_15750 [bacterium]
MKTVVRFIEGNEPDIISFGKKTQCCGIFAGNRLNEVDDHVFKESSRFNSTFGGNLVDMVRFTIYLELIEKDELFGLHQLMVNIYWLLIGSSE